MSCVVHELKAFAELFAASLPLTNSMDPDTYAEGSRLFADAYAAADRALATPPAEVGAEGARALIAWALDEELEEDGNLTPRGVRALRLAREALEAAAA